MKSQIILTFIFMPVVMIVSGQGNVGIGTNTPAEKLDVNGNISFTGELMPNGVAGQAGQVLQSNGDGTMQWSDASSIQGNIGYGIWDPCEMAGLSGYQPVTTTGIDQYDEFGYRVSISGSRAAVSSPYDDGTSGSDEGSVTIFKIDSITGAWIQDGEKLTGDADDHFGCSVSLSGDYLAVGAFNDTEFGISGGSVTVYKKNNTTGAWDQYGDKILNFDQASGDGFGRSVSLSGDYLIVGAPFDGEAAGSSQGTVSIYKRNPSTQEWDLQGFKIVDPDAAAGDQFGFSVAICGDYAMVGAPYDHGLLLEDQGSVSMFERNPTTGVWLLQQPKLFDNYGASNDQFGFRVSITDGFAIAGSPYDEWGTGTDQGSATIYKLDTISGTWQPHGYKLNNYQAPDNARFGFYVSISGNYALIGAYAENSFVGSVSLAVNLGPYWQLIQHITDPASQGSEFFGYSVSIDHTNNRFIIGAIGALDSHGKAVFGKY